MNLEFDVLVVGAGPAGLAASVAAAAAGLTVGLVDDNPSSGGQIWRGGAENSSHPEARRLWETLQNNPRVKFFLKTRILYPLSPLQLLAESADGACVYQFKKLILATGAREVFLPFPGWTLPHVTGAGGLQALVKTGLPIANRRVIVAGSGPLLLAVAAGLKRHGAHVVAIVEQAPWQRLLFFWLSLLGTPGKFFQSLQLLFQLKTVPYLLNAHVTAAHDSGGLYQVDIRHHRRLKQLECDHLACGFGLVPNSELAAALGCTVSDRAVQVDIDQQTSVTHIFCAGENTGIGGVEQALAEGQIAGSAAAGKLASELAGDLAENQTIFAIRATGHRFSRRLSRAFALNEQLRTLCDDTTIVCRCEDVTHAALRQHRTWKSAKLGTRCGMGPCQAKICGTATEFVYGWTEQSPRLPITPCRIGSMLIAEQDSDK